MPCYRLTFANNSGGFEQLVSSKYRISKINSVSSFPKTVQRHFVCHSQWNISRLISSSDSEPLSCGWGVYTGRLRTRAGSREWLAISSRINTWLFSLFRQTKQPTWNPNRLASPKFNLVFACGYIAKRQHHQRNSPLLLHQRTCSCFSCFCFCCPVLQAKLRNVTRTSAHVCIHGPSSPISLFSTALLADRR